MNPTINITIIAAQDGGTVIYEALQDEDYTAHEQRLVFGGNLEEASKYLTGRIASMLDGKGKRKEPPPAQKQIANKARKAIEALDALDALETAEDVA